MSKKHYVKNIAGVKFYPEGYNGWGNGDYSEYRLLAKPGEYYYLFLDIPLLYFL